VVHVQKTTEVSKRSGIYYNLPKTIVTIDVTITKTEKIKGPYAQYAQKYLGISNVNTANTTSYEISDIAFDTYTEPDSSQYYCIELNKCQKKRQSFFLSLSESGMIQSLNAKPDIKEVQNNSAKTNNDLTGNTDNYNYFAESNLFEKIDTIIEKVNLDTTIIEKKTYKRSWVEKSPELKAKEAADFIMRTKESRFNLLSGSAEVPYEKASVEYMNDKLELLENDFLSLFTGISKTKKLIYRFTYIPEASKTGNVEKLFLFSSKEGIVDSTSTDWETIELQLDKKNITNTLSTFIDSKNKISGKKHGLYYRIPEYGVISVKQGSVIKTSATFLINQLGVVNSLPPKKNHIQFYPNSGAVKTIRMGRYHR